MTVRDLLGVATIAIIVVFAIVAIYWLRAYANKSSNRRLEYLVKNKFKTYKDGTPEMQKLSGDDLIVDVTIKDKNSDVVTVDIKYKQPDQPYVTKEFKYKIKSVCGMTDPFCLTL